MRRGPAPVTAAGTSPPAAPRRPAATTRPASLRYLSFVAATGLSTFGDAAWIIALTTTLTRLSGAALSGLVLALAELPGVVAMLGAGAMADRRGAARVMVGSDLLRCLVMAVAAGAVVIRPPGLPLLVALAVLLAFLGAFFVPASGALRPQMLPPEHVVKGNVLYLIGLRSGEAAGGPAGAWLLGLGGIAAVAVTNAASYLVSAVATLRCAPRHTFAPAAEHDGTGTLHRIREGVRLVAADRPLAVVLCVVGMNELAGIGAIQLGLVLLSRHIGAGATGAGLLLTGYTVGATASFLLSLALPVGRHAGPLAIGGMTAYAAALAGLGHTGSLAGLMVLYGVLGAASAQSGVVLVSIVQRRMPPHAGARVMSILSLVIVGALPLGNLTVGAMVQWFGVPTTMAAHGALAFVGVLAFAADGGLRTIRLE